MPERKVWSAEEDEVLRVLKEQRGERKWSLIARKMEVEFGIRGRTGKQCRERYHNHLDANIVTSPWTQPEELALLQLHEEVGNKWSAIAQRLPGRSDNCVKNHFYSRLRRAVRQLNRVAQENSLQQITIDLLYRIIETTEERFKPNSRIDQTHVDSSQAIKNQLLRYNHPEGAHQILAAVAAHARKMKRGARGRDQRVSVQTVTATEVAVKEEEPFLEIFTRVCREVMRDGN